MKVSEAIKLLLEQPQDAELFLLDRPDSLQHAASSAYTAHISRTIMGDGSVFIHQCNAKYVDDAELVVFLD
jgi:hypothetical protein